MPSEIKCPVCESTAVVFEELHRTLTRYDVISDNGKNVIVAPKPRSTEVIDSMGNETRFACLDCAHTWDLDYAEYDGVRKEAS